MGLKGRMEGLGAAVGGPAATGPGAKSSATPAWRRCTRCGIRKVLGAFYRHRRGKYGHRPDCKKCANRERARQLRAKYVPKTGRRYVSKSDREPAAGTSAEPAGA